MLVALVYDDWLYRLSAARTVLDVLSVDSDALVSTGSLLLLLLLVQLRLKFAGLCAPPAFLSFLLLLLLGWLIIIIRQLRQKLNVAVGLVQFFLEPLDLRFHVSYHLTFGVIVLDGLVVDIRCFHGVI